VRESFPKGNAAVHIYERGYANHPRDPGGVTLDGVIQRVYDSYRSRKGRPRQALTRAMSGTAAWIAERDEIFRAQYWAACRCDELPAGVDLVVFDCAVNSGPYQAALWLQRALRMNNVDGHIGEGTLMAALSHPDHDALIADVLRRRLGMLKKLKTWDVFGKGWSRRVASVKAIGQAWAMGSVGPAPVPVGALNGNAKGYAGDVVQAPVSEDVAQTTGYGGAGGAATIQVARDQLEPLVGTSDFVTYLFLGLTVLAVLIAIGGAVATFYARRKNAEARAAINGELTEDVGDEFAAENGAPA